MDDLKRHLTMEALVHNLGSLLPLGAALVGIVIWLNGEFRRLETLLGANQQQIRSLSWCIQARESNPGFKCPPL